MSNIRVVAELAGVSVATVSRTLKQPESVSPKTRHRVLDAIQQAGYQPNQLAARLRSGKTHNLVVLVPTIANVFFARVISGMQQVAHEKGFTLLLSNTQADEHTESNYARMVESAAADGVIQLRAFNPFRREQVNEHNLYPMVNACEVLDNVACPTVMLDNRAAAAAMTRHLIELGHKRIALVKGPARSPLTRDRIAGYRDALTEVGIVFDEQLLVAGDFSLKAGFDAATQLLKLAERPTAIFCENDEMAIGAMQCLKQAGLRIPEDMSVAGFDDINFAEYSDPPLSTIAQPAEEFGRTAVSLLIDVLQGRVTKAAKVILPFDLIIRESTGPAAI